MMPRVALTSCSPRFRRMQLGLFFVSLACLPIAAQAQVSFDGLQTALADGLSASGGVAVDSSGNIFLADNINNSVTEILAAGGYKKSIPLGSGFKNPSSVAVDATGNVFVADSGNNAVKEILAVSGSIPSSPTINTLGSGFKSPTGVAVDGSGDVFVADTGNNAVKEILAVNGSIAATSKVNTLGSDFKSPTGVAVDGSGDVFVADAGNNAVKEILAVNGSIPSSPTINPLGSEFMTPEAVAVDGTGDVFVADAGNKVVKEILAVSGSVPLSSPMINTLGSDFKEPQSVAVDSNGNVFVADKAPGKITELALQSVNVGSQAAGSPSGVLSLPFTIGSSESTPVGSIAVLTTGVPSRDFVNAADSTCTAMTYTTATKCVVNVSFSPAATGLRRGAAVFYSGANRTGTVLATLPIYGIGAGPQIAFGPGGAQTSVGSEFISPEGVAVDAADTVYISDDGLQQVFKVTSNGAQTVIGSGLDVPQGVAVDGAGNVYISDSQFPAVFKVTPTGVQTMIGSGFDFPSGIAVDGAGNVYVSDPFNVEVFKITPSGAQSTIGSGFNTPVGVAVDAIGNVYVADSFNAAVYKIAPDGTQTTIGNGLISPAAVAVDAAGNVYITDDGPNSVFEVTPSGVQTTVSSGLNRPNGIAVDGSGNLYVANSFKSQVLKIDRVDSPSLTFDLTRQGATSKDSPRTVEVENIGNAPLQLSALIYPADFPAADSSATDICTSSTSLASSGICALQIDFTPINKISSKSSAILQESVTFASNSLNKSNAHSEISVTGTEAAQLSSGLATKIGLAANPARSAKGETVQLTATLTPFQGSGDSTNGENVSFYSNSLLVGTAKLMSGVAVLSTTALHEGITALTAVYEGDQNFQASTSPALSYTVVPPPTIATSVHLVANPQNSDAGESVQLTATLSPPSSGAETTNGETVLFYSNTLLVGTAKLTSGVATLNTTALHLGITALTAVYPGDFHFIASTSPAFAYTVHPAPATTSEIGMTVK
jgi:sugar lactone lactonase YvrE